MKTFKEFLLMEEELKNYEGDIVVVSHAFDIDEIPKNYQYNKVDGYFICSSQRLSSLKGSPKEVGEDFVCYDNKLTTLLYAPEKVGGYMNCGKNNLTSLKGIPKEIGSDFKCYENPNLFEVSSILNSKIGGKILYEKPTLKESPISDILNKYKNNPRNLIKMLVELKKIDKRFC